jgi:hypothetical protein
VLPTPSSGLDGKVTSWEEATASSSPSSSLPSTIESKADRLIGSSDLVACADRYQSLSQVSV